MCICHKQGVTMAHYKHIYRSHFNAMVITSVPHCHSSTVSRPFSDILLNQKWCPMCFWFFGPESFFNRREEKGGESGGESLLNTVEEVRAQHSPSTTTTREDAREFG